MASKKFSGHEIRVCMNIRLEEHRDTDKIRNVHLCAFETDAEAKLVDNLRKSGIELISLVAEVNLEIIGHILFSPVTVDGNTNIMSLAPIAVLPAWQGRGVGGRLIVEGLNACEIGGYGAVVVLGHPDFYSPFGFIPSVRFGIQTGYDAPPEYFMVKELQKGAIQHTKGTVHFHTAFKNLS